MRTSVAGRTKHYKIIYAAVTYARSQRLEVVGIKHRFEHVGEPTGFANEKAHVASARRRVTVVI
jgi:hypothetical protein